MGKIEFNGDEIFIVGDIGGTNTNIAAVGKSENRFKILKQIDFKTSDITDFSETFILALEKIKKSFEDANIKRCCISAAGPIEFNYCKLTNANWDIDGADLEKKSGLKVIIINDFVALSFGIPILDIYNEDEIYQLSNPDGNFPKPKGDTRAIVGAGTGLGVGIIKEISNNKFIALPSEGGHFDFPAFNKDTYKLVNYFVKRFGFHPGVEDFVSGIGLAYIFKFYVEENSISDSIVNDILARPEKDQAKFIAQNVGNNKTCAEVHKLYREIYGKMAGNYAAVSLPYGGIYIAGGVISKDFNHFISDNTFMSAFSVNHKDCISQLLKDIPVFIVKNYNTSLLGAANAANSLLE